jgi:hypothetical protein
MIVVGVMVSVDREFEPQSGHTKDYKTTSGCCKHRIIKRIPGYGMDGARNETFER